MLRFPRTSVSVPTSIFDELYNLQKDRKNSQLCRDKHRPSNLIPKHTSRFAMVSVENWTKFVTEWHTSSRDQWMGSQSKQRQEQWEQQSRAPKTYRETMLIFAYILSTHMVNLSPRRYQFLGLVHCKLGKTAARELIRAVPTMLLSHSHKVMPQTEDSGASPVLTVRRHRELNMDYLRPMILHNVAHHLVQQWRQETQVAKRVAKMIQWRKKCERAKRSKM